MNVSYQGYNINVVNTAPRFSMGVYKAIIHDKRSWVKGETPSCTSKDEAVSMAKTMIDRKEWN